MDEKEAAPARWAIVEIMGHHRTAGRIEEVQQFGASMLRVDRPHEDGTFTTEFYGGTAIYALRPCAEDIARRTAAQMYDERPVAPLDYRLPAPSTADDDGEEYPPVYDRFDEDDNEPL